MINEILVATDASAASDRAVTYAARLSVKHEAQLLILNVIRDMQLPQALKEAPEFEAFNNAREDLMRQAAEQILGEAKRAAKKAGAREVQTAIGDEPGDPSAPDSMPHWQNAMCGYAAANIMPLVASNRIGTETATISDMQMTFYGSSFIADEFGNKVEQANRSDQAVPVQSFDLAEIRRLRET